MSRKKKPEFIANIDKNDEHYDLINNLWLYMSHQKDPYTKDIEGSVEEVDKLLKEVAKLITKNNKFSITSDNYVETLLVNGHTVVVGLDDYGQCYYFEWYDEEDKQVHSMGCGTYNFNYKQEIEDFFKPHEEYVNEKLRDLSREQLDILRDVDNLKNKKN